MSTKELETLTVVENLKNSIKLSALIDLLCQKEIIDKSDLDNLIKIRAAYAINNLIPHIEDKELQERIRTSILDI